MKLKTIKLLLQLSNILSACHRARVMAVRLPHYLVDDEFRITTDVKSLDPKLDGNAHAIDECLVFCHIIGHEEVQSNHVEEPISLSGDPYYASPGPVESEGAIEIHALVLLGDRGGCCVSVHSAMKTARAWDLITIYGT
jgi:hypothetical protein